MLPSDRLGGRSVVVWRVGDAVLGADLEDVLEVAAVDGEGRAQSRSGPVELVTPPDLEPRTGPAVLAVVLRGPHGPLAVPAEAIDGVREVSVEAVQEPPDWLRGLTPGVRGLLRLEDGRIAALVRPGALSARS